MLLTVIHRRLSDRATMLNVSAGWHMHLDILVARATGKEPEPFWDGWSRRKTEYDRRHAGRPEPSIVLTHNVLQQHRRLTMHESQSFRAMTG